MTASRRRPGTLARLHLACWSLWFVAFWWRAFRVDAAGNLVSGHPGLWADWALHFTLGNVMATRALVPATSPLLLGQPFAYPFAADLLSALLLRAGVPMVAAFVLPSLAFSVLLVFALFWLLRLLFRSEAVAVLGSWLFLCAGGLGFVTFAREVARAAHPLAALLAPAHPYTRVDGTPIVLLSTIEAIVLPQRGFTHGFPLALLALGLVRSALPGSATGVDAPAPPARRWPLLACAAAILGVLPLVHAHSFLAVFVVLLGWAAGDVLLGPTGSPLRRLLPWAALAAATGAVALPLTATFLLAHVGEGFVRWFPGWYARELHVGWVRFWLENWSALPVLAAVGLALRVRDAEGWRGRLGVLALFLPFLALFALVNLLLFAPWIFDNTKLLAWAAVGLAGLAADAVVRLWRGARGWPARAAAVALVVACIASGAIDAYRLQRVDLHQNVMYTAEELELARWARQNTAAGSLWLTADQHNHWVTNLTGRQVVMAYRGWLWSHGYRYGDVERDVGEMLRTADPALLARYGVDYVVLGPAERGTWHASDAAFARFPVAIRTRAYTVYRVR